MVRSRYAIVSFTLLMAIAGLALSSVHYEVVRGYLDSFAGDGSAEPYTRELHRRLCNVAFIGGVVLFVSSLALWRNFEAVFVWSAVVLRSHRPRCLRTVRLFCWLVRENGLWIFCLTFVGALLRTTYLFQPVRFDEAYTYLHFAQYPWYIGISLYDDPNNHVLHTLCVRICRGLFGEELWALRLPAFIAGVLTVPATFLAARIQGGRAAGIIAGCIVAASSVLIEYSTNARGYTIICLCSILAMAAATMIYREAIGHGSKGLYWHILALVSVIGLWTIPVMLYPLTIIWSWTLIAGNVRCAARRRRKFLHAWFVAAIATGVVVLILYAPVLFVSGWRNLLSNPYVQPLAWNEFFDRLPLTIFESYELLSRDWPLVLQLVLCLGFGRWLFGAFTGSRREQPWRAVFLSVVLCAGIAVSQRVTPPARVWTFLIPMLAVSSSAGLAQLLTQMKSGSRMAAVLALSLIVLLWPVVNQWRTDSVLQSSETGVCPDAEDIVLFLKRRFASDSDSGNAIAFISVAPVSAPVAFYARRHGMSSLHFRTPDRQLLDDAVVLVTLTRSQTVRDVLTELALDMSGADSYQPIQEFSTAVLYRPSIAEQSLPASASTKQPD